MIIITVPHAATTKEIARNEVGMPLSEEYHFTDWLAEPAAVFLHQMLPGSILLVGDVNRRKIDLNRFESRKTGFRKNLRKILTNLNAPIVIDVHSADSNFFGKTDVALLQPDPRGILDYQVSAHLIGKANRRRPTFVDGYVIALEKHLGESGVGHEVFCAWPLTTDLVREARELGAAAVLIEFNEETIKTQGDLERCCSPIIQWLNELNTTEFIK